MVELGLRTSLLVSLDTRIYRQTARGYRMNGASIAEAFSCFCRVFRAGKRGLLVVDIAPRLRCGVQRLPPVTAYHARRSRPMEWVTTTTILRDLKAFENDTAWQGFVDRFYRPVVRFVRRVGISPEESEDVAQESLLAFAEGYRTGRYERLRGRLSSWLFGIAYRQALASRRKSRSRKEEFHTSTGDHGESLEDLPDHRAASGLWDGIWDRYLLQQCLELARQEFQPRVFQAFVLVVGDEKTPAEAAEELNIPVKSVYNYKHRVLSRLRQLRAELEGSEDPVDGTP